MDLRHLAPTTWYDARIDHPDITDIKGILVMVAVRHTPDRGTKVPHTHMVLQTTLSAKNVRKALRDAYRLEGRMSIMLRPYDPAKADKLIRYYLDHDSATVLKADQAPFDVMVPATKAIVDAEREQRQHAQTAREERWRIREEAQVRYEQLHQEQWDIEPNPDGHPTNYREVMDTIEYMARHWHTNLNNRDWDIVDLGTHVLQYLCWPTHDTADVRLYRMVYSEYRFRGDIKLLYGRLWGVTPDLVTRMFGTHHH